MKFIRKFRRNLANFILGDDTVLFTNGRDYFALKEHLYLDASDEAVGRMFKHFWAIVSRHYLDQAEEEGRTFRDTMISGSVLYLASVAARQKSDSTTFAVSGSLDAGRTEGKWAVRVESCPDYKIGKVGEVRKVEDDDGRITEFTVTYGNPGYEDWKEQNRQRREAEQ